MIGTAAPGTQSRLYDDRAVMPLLDDGVLEVARDPAVAVYRHPRRLSDEEMLHPWLVPAAATVSAWHGRRVLHGGLVSSGGRAVAVVGDKEGGKSTLLAWMALSSSLSVMADDLVVFDGDTAFAGPRCIDLRPGAIAHLPSTAGAERVRGDTRWRLPLPAAPATSRLVGIVVLEWGSQTRLTAVPPSQRLARLLPHALTEGIPLGTAGVLGFTRYRSWVLSRPRRWDALEASAAALAGLLA